MFQHLRDIAPHATVELVGWNRETLLDIRNGDVLIGISMQHDLISGVKSRQVVDLKSRVFVRSGHPLTGPNVTPQQLEPYPIASIVTPRWNDNRVLVAEIMKQQGLDPKVGFRSEFVMAVVDVIEHTELFMAHSDLFPSIAFQI
ncbi:LysR substrate-binding domain-containing protein [Shewanella maritima]|uniref:LysR substrate-binding domain-containing protein n=1 Tax=Shewanella maritima TaxID=2520507 RepID=UPI001F5FB7BB|nr:LysR substrate-binding domain-containing protein [Shewanella maritima]